ncbi:MAG TPA: EAL domain-containing protein [Saccharospirillum sp.]|nr:EAL domain-containing protein [Saccharospirillum sp.]
MLSNELVTSLFESIMTASQDAVIISDAQGNIVHASRSAESLFHFSPGHLNGVNISQLMPQELRVQHDGFLTRHQEADRPAIIDQSRVVTAVDAEGKEFPIYLTVTDATLGDDTWYIAFCHDLRSEHKAERDRKRYEALQNTLFDAAADGIVTIDERGFIQSFNAAAQTLFGWAPAEVIGRNVSVLMPVEYGQKHDDYIKNYLDGGPARIIGIGREVTGLRHDGTTFPMHLSVGEAVVEGSRTFIGICHDLSTRQKLMNEIHDARQEAEYLETHDALTGYLTKEALIKQFPGWINTHSSCAMVALSYSRFGAVNQRYGYEEGDRILRWMARQLEVVLPAASLFARMSGSHLIAVIPGSDSEEVSQYVRNMVALMEEPYQTEADTVRLSARAGICLCPQDTCDIGELVQWSEAAMMNVGSDIHIGFFNPEDHARLTRTMDIEQALRSAIQGGQFEAYLQPKVVLKTGERAGYEALVRWPQPDGTFVSPAEFVPIAEAIGLGKELDRFMINQVVHHQAERHKEGKSVLPIAVNITADHFSDVSLLNLVNQSLDLWTLSPSDLILEITEGSLVRPEDEVLEHLRQFKDRGVKIDIDDFGTGYSSLGYLKNLPVTGIKIDKVFVDEVLTAPGYQMIEGILAIARSLSLTVVAEGVERPEQVDALLKLGCEFGQGYWFDRPFPLQELDNRSE